MGNATSTEPNVTLSYFDFAGGRGEPCRMALHLAGVEFHDDRIKGAGWSDKKSSTPYGGMPVLTIKGKGELAQSNVILGFIGAGHGLLPEDNFEAARHRAILSSVEELSVRLGTTMRMSDDDKKAARQDLAAGYMKDWSANMEKQIAGPFVGGETISVADLKLYGALNWVKSGALDHIQTDFFDGYVKLAALFDAVGSHPKIVEYHRQN